MLPEHIILPLQDTLTAFSEGWAEVSLAADPFNVFEQLTTGPNSTLIILHWAGDKPAGSARQSPFVRNTLEVYVGRNKGLSLNPNETLYREDLYDSEKPLSQITANVREHLRSFSYDSVVTLPDTAHEPALSYGGCDSVILPSGLPMAAYKLSFNLVTSLPTIP
jgi:hypothetical protein